MIETVLALVPRQNLNAVLTGFHRGGYGHLIRVMDPERASLTSQLQRAGVADARLAGDGDQVVVFVPAPGRAPQAASIALSNGASDVEVVQSAVATTETVTPRLMRQAGARRSRRSARQTPASPAVSNATDTLAD
jgi:hypothetical protein